MNIGQVVAATGVSAKRIRYYEQIGLLGRAKRSASGYRMFGRQDLHKLSFIRWARRLGLSMPNILALLESWQDQGRSSDGDKRPDCPILHNLEWSES